MKHHWCCQLECNKKQSQQLFQLVCGPVSKKVFESHERTAVVSAILIKSVAS